MRNIYSRLLQGIEAGQRLAFATLISTKGSTPQIAGASALFSEDGLLEGTLGGGVLEADAQTRALRALRSGDSMMYHYELMSDISELDRAICGGSAVVLIDVLPGQHAESLREMRKALEQRRPGALLTRIAGRGGEMVVLERHWVADTGSGLAGAVEPYLAHLDAIAWAVAERKPVALELEESMLREGEPDALPYVEPAFSLPRLIITGAGHVGRALAHYGKLLDFEITVIDDRPEFANSENIPDADHIIVDDIGEAVGRLDIGRDTFIVIVNRGHRGDAEALRACITSEAAYIGMIGSRRKIEQVREKFLRERWSTAEQFARVHAPIGLDIDAKTVEEIGISIAAELVAERRRFLRGELLP